MKVVLFSPPKVVELYVGLTSFLGSLLGPTERVSSRKNGVKIFFLLMMMVLLIIRTTRTMIFIRNS